MQVALALALGKQPDLLLLDEPTASLDPLARREFLGTVRAEAARTGITVVFSTHVVGELGQAALGAPVMIWDHGNPKPGRHCPV